jgi:glycosyltransferase involved in cell wall biosynthesis
VSATVCLLTPAPLWLNPRLVKEADALHAAGYQVVVGYRADGDVTRDDALLASKPWRWRRVDMARDRVPGRWLRAAVRQRAAEWLVRLGVRAGGIEAAAYCRGDRALLIWAGEQAADLYIAHTQPVLAIASEVARRRGVPFAFDCEDLLAEEAADGGRAPWRRALVRRLERRHLPRAAYVSATSAPMAEYLAAEYGLSRVLFWHNAFPRSVAADVVPPDHRAVPQSIGLVWISAVVGPGRGLEDIFSALPRLAQRLAPRVTLHLYGAVPASSAAWLEGQLDRDRSETHARVEIHGVVPPDRVVVTLSGHQIGLALDGSPTLNRRLTVSNKLFLYLDAGLACVATNTPGHQSVLPSGVAWGAVYDPGDVAGLVAAITRLSEPSVLVAAQRGAFELGRGRLAWDAEQSRFLDAVARALGNEARGEAGGRGTAAPKSGDRAAS